MLSLPAFVIALVLVVERAHVEAVIAGARRDLRRWHERRAA